MNIRKRTAGVALISVMSIAGITGALAYHLISMQSLTIAHANISTQHEYALEYAYGIERFATLQLTKDWVDTNTRSSDSLVEEWAFLENPFEFPDGTIQFQLIDLTSKLNLNALANPIGPEAYRSFQNLCGLLGLDQHYADLWKDWVDPDSESMPFGGEDFHYTILDPAFRPPNALGVDISEISYIADVSRADIHLLYEYTVTLPTMWFKANINTVSPQVLQSMFPNPVPSTQLDKLFDGDRVFSTVETATSRYPVLEPISNSLTTQSDFFSLEVTLRGPNRLRIDLTSDMYRHPEDGAVYVYKRSFAKKHQWDEASRSPIGTRTL